MPTPDHFHVLTFSQEHIQQMIAACDLTTVHGQRDYIMLLILSQTGIRVSELCKLRIQDIHETSLHIIGKTHTSRDLQVTQQISQQLKTYLNAFHKVANNQEAFVFMDNAGQPLTPDAVSRWFSTIKKQAGIEGEGLSIHAFRNTYAAQLFQAYTSW